MDEKTCDCNPVFQPLPCDNYEPVMHEFGEDMCIHCGHEKACHKENSPS